MPSPSHPRHEKVSCGPRLVAPMKATPHNPGAPVPTRVLCADDNPDMTAVLRLMIDAEPGMECVTCLTSADRLLDEVRRSTPPPDVIILDATMPGKNAFEAMGEVMAEFPAVKTIVLSGHDDEAFLARAEAAGAWGCVSKREDPETILRAVREVAAGTAWWPRDRR